MKNKLIVFLLVFCLILPFYACDKDTNGEIVVIDQMGYEVSLKETPNRIVSGYYISTSALLALGLKEKIVGVETDSEKRPLYQKCASELIDPKLDVGSAKNFDLEKCVSLSPDLVILPKKAKDNKLALNEVGIPVLIVNPESQSLLEEMISILGKATNTENKAQNLISYYHEKIEFIENNTKDITNKPNIFMCSTSDYLRGASTSMYQNTIIELAGGKNVVQDNNGNFVNVGYEQFLSYNPDIIIVPTNATASSDPTYVSDMLSDKEINSVSAIKNGKVYQMPSGFESWDSPVPSGILGTLWLLNKLHPEKYNDLEFIKDVNDFYKTFYSFNANF